MDYLLIDGNNLAIRSAFANDKLTNKDGVLSGAHFGFFNSLLTLKKKFPNHQMLVAWDRSSKRRKEESQKGVEEELIPEAYKQNRKKEDPKPPLQTWFDTGHHLQNALGKTGIPQIFIEGFEADDVIASYCELLKGDNQIIVVTSDKDFYQLLDDNVIVWDGMKEDYVTKDSFEEQFGITPEQHVHVGALMGDNGDNIFGIPGWGEKTALNAIKKSGTWEAVIVALEEKHSELIKKHAPLTTEDSKLPHKLNPAYQGCSEDDDPQGCYYHWHELAKAETKSGKLKYPEIYWGMPHSGLLSWFEEGKIKMPKTDLMALMFKDRVKLAYSLKKMDKDIPDLPEITYLEKDKVKLLEYFEYYGIASLVDKVDILFD